ncbi:MAG TPA: GldG family protein, partial [Clostridia bacterium]
SVFLVNFIISTLQQKKIINATFDITPNKVYTVGDKTKSILKDLKKDVNIYILASKSEFESLLNSRTGSANLGTQIDKLIEDYQKNSQHIKFTYMDPDKNPGFVQSIDPSGIKQVSKGSIVVKCGNKIKNLTPNDMASQESDPRTNQPGPLNFTGENTITGAIKYVTSPVTPVIYFVKNHGEQQLEDNFTTLTSLLGNNNYDVKSLDLLSDATVPKDAEILMFPSPKTDLAPTEKTKLKDFLDNGGKCIFLFNYLETSTKFSGFEDVLKDYNVGLNYDKVKETDNGRYLQSPYNVVLDVPQSSIIPQQNVKLLLINSRSLNILKNQKQNLTVTSIMKTSNKAVSEPLDKSVKSGSAPLDLGLAVESKDGSKSTKILVIGNGSFVSDDTIQRLGQYAVNGINVFAASLDWMMDKKNDVQIDPKTPDNQTLVLSSDTQYTVLRVILFAFVLLILGTGMFVWTRRKHL